MRPTGVKFLAKAADARLLGNTDAVVCDVEIDSRNAEEGEMFVCVVGEINDGHNFAGDAYERGCRIFLMSDEWKAIEMAEKDRDVCVILAEDTSAAFRDMAKAYLDQFKLKKIAITGSVGKTSTRNFTAAVLSEKYNTICSQKNYNTHLGLCLTCFAADSSTEVIVFEMGMDRKNEIAEYVDWIFPETAVITNIGISHLEKLGSRDAIADAKLEITKNFHGGNLLIYNALSDYLSEAEIKSRAPGDYRLFSVGRENCDLNFSEAVYSEAGGIDFTLSSGEANASVHMDLLGRHNAVDAALAAAVGLSLDVDLESAARGLAKVKPQYRRLNAVKHAGITIIDDTYNASPDSMKAALDVMGSIKAERKICILADMLELGEASEDGHLEVGRAACGKGIELLYAIGKSADLYRKGAEADPSIKVICAEKLEELEGQISDELESGDAVLIKGSNVTGVAGLAQRLMALTEGKENNNAGN